MKTRIGTVVDQRAMLMTKIRDKDFVRERNVDMRRIPTRSKMVLQMVQTLGNKVMGRLRISVQAAQQLLKHPELLRSV